MKTMKALVKSKLEPGLWLEEVPVPEIGINDVLIKIQKTGICGTDVHIYNWDEWAQKTIPIPMPVGHEFVARSLRSEAMFTTSKSATWSPERDTSSAAAAATAWREGGIFAGARVALGSTVPEPLRNTFAFRDECLVL